MNREAIKNKLRELRGHKTLEEVAMAVGVTRQAICNYELGTRIPSDDVKIKLADYFGTTVQYIFYE